MPRPNNINWQIESIRVTAFVNGQLNPSMLETWLEKVSENSPSKISKTPSSFVGVSRSTAGFLRINWTANRLDVILSSEEPQSVQAIAPISEVTSLFSRIVERVPEIGELALIDRLALGLVLSFQVPSESEGFKILSSSIVGLNLPESARDFLYRVNHPCGSSTVIDLNINRLATWSISKVQVIQVHIKSDGTQDQQTISEAPLAIRLELDINTDQAVQLAADLEKLRNLLDELKQIALVVASDGEATMR
jgi:hypothetical protein